MTTQLHPSHSTSRAAASHSAAAQSLAPVLAPVGVRPQSRPIGELLIEMRVLGAEGLAEGLAAQHLEGERIGETLVRLKHCSEWDVCQALAQQFGLAARESIEIGDIQDELVERLPIQYARSNTVLPWRFEPQIGVLQVFAADPLRILDLDDLCQVYGAVDLEITLMPRSTVLDLINRVYARRTKDVDLEKKDEEYAEEDEDILHASAEDAPIIRFVNSLIFNASKEKASDIHIEPGDKEIMVRNRVDGVLHEVKRAPKAHLPSIIARVKIMAGLNIAEKRLPQDGRIKIRFNDNGHSREIDFRVSVLPTLFGEKIVMRLLDKDKLMLDMTKLGFEPESLTKFQRAIANPYGMVLVTGPTGSGKSTTLASLIEHVNQTSAKHVLTLEDPVELQYTSKRSIIHQREVGTDVESFASGLRAALREDPDIILVGEMRDQDTIAAALTAAETGHLVLSTLHSASAGMAIDRIIDVFPGPKQAQVRLQLAGALRAIVTQVLLPSQHFGRVPAYEKMIVTTAVASQIREGRVHQIANQIQTGRAEGMTSLEQSLQALLRGGRISMEAAMAVATDPEGLRRALRS